MSDLEANFISVSETTSLLRKSASLAEPFSLSGLKSAITAPIKAYEKFAMASGARIEAVESTLRSLCYLLPGRFKDSEFISEIRKLKVLNVHRDSNSFR